MQSKETQKTIPSPYLELSQSMKSTVNVNIEWDHLCTLTHPKKLYIKECLTAWSAFSMLSKALIFLFFQMVQNKHMGTAL